jgi:hypothetical protein
MGSSTATDSDGSEVDTSFIGWPALRISRGLTVATCLALVLAAGEPAAQVAVSSTSTLTPAAMETFLLEARIIKEQGAGGGVTGSRLVTMTDGTITHDAHVQTVDISQTVFHAGEHSETNFKDTYRYNIAAYRVARLIGLTTVPMSVKRYVNGKEASVTWWVDDIAMDEKARVKARTSGPNPGRTGEQIQTMRVFDELIQNKDRNLGNILWDEGWTLWLIDHTRAFRLNKKLLKPERLVRCDRELLQSLRTLAAEPLKEAVGDSLTKYEQEALLARRDQIVKIYDDRIAKYGEATVLFTAASAVRGDRDRSP